MTYEEALEKAAEKYVFEENGHFFSNNNDEAANNFTSFKAGAQWAMKYIAKETAKKMKAQSGKDSSGKA